MVDDFDCDTTILRLVEGAGYVAVERSPGFFVDFGLQSDFERFVRIVRPQKVGVADKEAFFVVVRVNEPTGNAKTEPPARAIYKIEVIASSQQGTLLIDSIK